MTATLQAIGAPLIASPLFWLTTTLAAYGAGRMIQRLLKGSPFANPVLIAIVLVAALLEITGTSYANYFAGVQIIHFLLGPATVALAVPLAINLPRVRRSFHGVGLALVAGSATSTVAGVAMVALLGGGRSVAFSMAPKAATTPIAMAISQETGGMPALTASLAIAGGIIAAVIGQKVLRWFQIQDWRAHGLAAGVCGSGVAAAQVAPFSDVAAAFAALGIGLNGLLTALIVPIVGLIWKAS